MIYCRSEHTPPPPPPGSALTWTLYLLAQNPDKMAKAQVGVRGVPLLNVSSSATNCPAAVPA